MSNASTQTDFSAFGNRELMVIRVDGPGVCRESGRFENLLLEVERRGYQTLVLDFSACPRMDSTFAGALLRLASRLGVDAANGSSAPMRVVLAGLTGVVSELLDTLCVTRVLETVPVPRTEDLPAVPVVDRDLAKDQIMALSLDGHERLAALTPENERRFAALLPMLRQQVASSAEGSGSKPADAQGRTECP
ncbi:MAG: STAS domain-containing protein [Verrucomicrobiales bacterium]|nr:STAS domain-containing protein [Verrucomicrobiales bacterium]